MCAKIVVVDWNRGGGGMTENEAIEIINDVTWKDFGRHPDFPEARKMAVNALKEIQKYRKIGNILKFYYCDSQDDYLIGLDVGDFYAHYRNNQWMFDMIKEQPYCETNNINDSGYVHNYTTKPRLINFSDWLNGFMNKYYNGIQNNIFEINNKDKIRELKENSVDEKLKECSKKMTEKYKMKNRGDN